MSSDCSDSCVALEYADEISPACNICKPQIHEKFNSIRLDYPYFQPVVASFVGSTVSSLIINPINVIKLRLQSSANSMRISTIISSIYSQNRFKGFYSGLSLSLFNSIPSTIVYMSIYEHTKAKFQSNSNNSLNNYN